MASPNLLLIVDDKARFEIVTSLLIAAKFPLRRIRVAFTGESERGLDIYKNSFLNKPDTKAAILLDSDRSTIPDAYALAEASTVDDRFIKFFAIPSIEAWLFADPTALSSIIRPESVEILNRLPLPEEIPYPKQVARNLLGVNYRLGDYRFMRDINITNAAARSFSLHHFLTGIAKAIEIESPLTEYAVSNNIDRRIFANLIKEVLPGNSIIYRTLEGNKITVNEMLDNIEQGSTLGQQYTSDILRVARDFLKRQANK